MIEKNFFQLLVLSFLIRYTHSAAKVSGQRMYFDQPISLPSELQK